MFKRSDDIAPISPIVSVSSIPADPWIKTDVREAAWLFRF